MAGHVAGIVPDAESRLAHEARLLAWYLVGRDCPNEMVDRYVRGQQVLANLESSVAARALADFAFAHPWTIPLLDAAGAFVSSGALLRGKLHLMAAILEAAPTFAADFLPRSASRWWTFVQLAGLGVMAAAKALVGIPLALGVGWRHR